ncbi:hypothetical protein FJTKL_12649 [Diaporthe vaccinii]|uniref:Uncharacterized protein n=1 Tax=Diaporthe vaccinii TaxID=105482 RepID=A0ABR4EDC8_9PEZI
MPAAHNKERFARKMGTPRDMFPTLIKVDRFHRRALKAVFSALTRPAAASQQQQPEARGQQGQALSLDRHPPDCQHTAHGPSIAIMALASPLQFWQIHFPEPLDHLHPRISSCAPDGPGTAKASGSLAYFGQEKMTVW